MSESCPECLRKDQEKGFADRDHEAEVEKLTASVQAAETRIDSMSKELEGAREAQVEAAKNQALKRRAMKR